MHISRRILAVVAALFFALPAMAAEPEAAPGRPADAPSYVRFPPIFIPIIEGDRVTRQIGVTLMLQLVKGQDEQPIDAKRLQLNDAFVEDLYAFFQQRSSLPGNAIDETYLKGRLLKVADNVIGQSAVQEVLIEQIFEEQK